MAVLEKVKRHRRFADMPEQDQVILAHELSDPQKVKEMFKALLNIEEFEANIREIDEVEPAHFQEELSQKNQQKHETARACYLPVQLFLSKLTCWKPPFARQFTSLLRFEYGPLHTGLIVGDISIEWDDDSLVVPKQEPFAGDVQAHVGGDSEWIDYTKDAVGLMSLANRQHLDVPKKLEIIYNSCAEKERLLGRLADVIVQYNLSKRYSIFKCNCQDFVKDALQSLGIKRLPKFEGNLKGYIEGLQGSKAACMTFDKHSAIDDYVRANLDALGVHEKEYLVCMYFQFHMAEMKELGPEELDKWECPVRGCLSGDLECQIVDDALHFYQFQKQHREKAVSHVNQEVRYGKPVCSVCNEP